MNTVAKKRLLIGTIIVLIIINISALSTMVFHKYQRAKNSELSNNNDRFQYNQRNKRQKPYHLRVKKFVKQELSLSDKQFEQYVNLKDLNIKISDSLRLEIGHRKKLIFKAYCEEMQDTARLNKMADEVGHLHTQIQKETLRHFQAMEKILTPEQLIKFKLMLCNMSNRQGYGHFQRGRKDGRRMNIENCK